MSRPLTLALDLSDRTVALHLRLSKLPDDVRIEHIPQRTAHRHERMLESLEWEVCEFSLATYIAARTKGWAARAIAVFPRRLFATSLWFVRRASTVANPKQLAGRRVGIRSFHTTLCVWGLGDLASVYGVPLAEVKWLTERADPFPVERGEPWNVEQVDRGDSLDAAFDRGDIDAVLVPRVPPAVRRGSAIPLFRPPEQALRHYFQTTAVFPIMHTLVVREDVLEGRPALPHELRAAFEDSKRVGYSLYEDPNWCLLAQANDVLQSERSWLGDDPYPNGVEANKTAIDRLIGYERMLGLIADDVSTDSLFVPDVSEAT